MGWNACHWRPNAQADVSTLRGKIDEAMRLLDEFATLADTGFQSTHGKSQRRRDPGSSRSKKQFGMGWSQQAVGTARRQGSSRVQEFKFEFGDRVELEFEFEFEFRNSHELELLRTRTRETHIKIVENSNSNELETR